MLRPPTGPPKKVSNHAVLRYAQRVLRLPLTESNVKNWGSPDAYFERAAARAGIDVAAVRAVLAPAADTVAVNEGDRYVAFPDFTALVRGGCVVTVAPPGFSLVSGFHTRRRDGAVDGEK